jgi:antitoxin (DNA-binding transcriptional repressor) of toxin-antitoxin stability system
MKTFNIHEAKTHLSRLIEMAEKGEPFIIARAGKPVVRVEALNEVPTQVSPRIGFMEGAFEVPDDIDTMFRKDIEEMFYGSSPPDVKKSVD